MITTTIIKNEQRLNKVFDMQTGDIAIIELEDRTQHILLRTYCGAVSLTDPGYTWLAEKDYWPNFSNRSTTILPKGSIIQITVK